MKTFGRRDVISLLSAVALSSVVASGAIAQDEWSPTRNMNLIVASGPGTAFDVLARGMAAIWPKYFGVDLIVQNLDGAGGLLGIDYVAKSDPDGHTIGLMSNGSYLDLTIERGFDWNIADIPVLIGIDTPPVVVMTGPNSGFKTWDDVRAADRMVRFGNAGSLYMDTTGIVDLLGKGRQVTTAAFGGTGAVLTALEAGDVDVWASAASVIAMNPIREERVIPLFVYGGERYQALPDVPTHAELGMPAEWSNVGVVRQFIAPLNTPPEIQAGLEKRMLALLEDPEIKQWSIDNGLVYRLQTGEDALARQNGFHKIITDNQDVFEEYGG